jgi:ubiquinone/menaquinone biosynthesis C-methylase UbiE
LNSSKLAAEHYIVLGSEKMASLMSDKRHSAYLRFLRKTITSEHKILDLACGYGRITVPLAKEGYNIEGIDIAPNFISDAKQYAKKEGVQVPFRTGDMCALPYNARTFDRVFCLWSSFNHLLSENEQVAALNEMLRVLKPQGYAIIDLPFFGRQNTNIKTDTIAGVPTTSFIHDRRSIQRAIQKSKVLEFEIKIRVIGGRKRLMIYLYNSEEKRKR